MSARGTLLLVDDLPQNIRLLEANTTMQKKVVETLRQQVEAQDKLLAAD